MKELYLLLEEEELTPQQQADNKMCSGDAWTPSTVSGVPTSPGGEQDQPPLQLRATEWWLFVVCTAGRGGFLLGCHSQGWFSPPWHLLLLSWGWGWDAEGISHRVAPQWAASTAGPWFPPLTPVPPRQPKDCIKTLAEMKVTLQELCTELREERRGAGELQQQFTKAKAAWEMERAELKCHIAQVGAPAACGLAELPLAWWGHGAEGLHVPGAGCWAGLSGRVAPGESQ